MPFFFVATHWFYFFSLGMLMAKYPAAQMRTGKCILHHGLHEIKVWWNTNTSLSHWQNGLPSILLQSKELQLCDFNYIQSLRLNYWDWIIVFFTVSSFLCRIEWFDLLRLHGFSPNKPVCTNLGYNFSPYFIFWFKNLR